VVRGLSCAAIGEIGGDAGRPERVTADRFGYTGGSGTPSESCARHRAAHRLLGQDRAATSIAPARPVSNSHWTSITAASSAHGGRRAGGARKMLAACLYLRSPLDAASWSSHRATAARSGNSADFRPRFPLKSAYVVENSRVKKTKILTLYEGSGSTPVDG